MIPNKNTKIALNGPRPSPLKIQKHSSSSNSSSYHISKQTRKKPVIIYDNSPKIIHTKPNDFRALVQKLTGLSHDRALQDEDDDDDEIQKPNNKKVRRGIQEVNDWKDRDGCATSSLDSVSLLFKMPISPYLADIPLFTPNLVDFLCSPRSLFRLSPNMGNSFSPSFVEVMKGLPEY